MQLEILGSSSAGNCYLLRSKLYNETLIVEAGIKPFEVQMALNFRINSVVGCIVSHRHQDHAKYIESYIRSGIYVLAHEDVWNHEKVINRYAKRYESNCTYEFGHFNVLPLPVNHDVPCLAYIIKHPDMGSLLFVTDTGKFTYNLPDTVNHLMIEANYSNQILESNISRGKIAPSMRYRLVNAHMEIRDTAEIIMRNKLPKLSNVVLIHLSDNNSDEEEFKRYIKGICGVPTYVANKDMTIELNNEYDG